jgi:hypothetical protein
LLRLKGGVVAENVAIDATDIGGLAEFAENNDG